MEKVKIHTKKGRIITLKISKKTDTHLQGTDLYDEFVIIPIEDIYEMYPIFPQEVRVQ